MQLLGANVSAVAQGLEPQPGVMNYFIGNDPKKWHSGIPTYAKVHYTGVYPGIDLVFYGNQRQLEYDFVVAPGADPTQIAWKIAGGVPTIDVDGNLLLKAANGPASFKKPVVYQLENGNKVSIDSRYVVSGNQVRFALGSYDHAKPLVIDPVLSYATYLGGAVNQYSSTNGYTTIGAWNTINGLAFGQRTQGIAVDSEGCVYVTGSTNAIDFPVQDPYQSTAPGLSVSYHTHAAFVTKFNRQGTGLIYSTYLAGVGSETPAGYMMPTVGTSIAVDTQGSAYIVGYTNDYTFPVTQGAYQTLCGANWTGSAPNFTRTHGCGYNNTPSGFLTKLDPTGQNLIYSTFLGGARGGDYIFSVAVDTKGQAYVAGTSTDACQLFNGDPSFACFPTTAGAVLPGTASFFSVPQAGGGHYYAYSNMAFVSVFDAHGAKLLYSTYVGENTALISSGAVSPSMNGDTSGYAVALDSAGDFFLLGLTSAANLPITAGAFQSAPSWLPKGFQGFVAKFSPVTASGSTLTYLTYLGGPTSLGYGSWPSGIAANSAGEAYVTGHNSDPHFPTTAGAYQTSCGQGGGNSCQNAFISKLNASGTNLVWSTMLGHPPNSGGGTVSDLGPIQMDSAGNVYITGTALPDQYFPQVNPIQTTSVQPTQFVAKFDPTGTQLLFSTFIGDSNLYGSTYDAGMVVGGGNIYLAGNTTATGIPVTPGAFQQNFVGTGDGYIMKIAQLSGFGDVPLGYWAYDYIMAIYEDGITAGCSQNPPIYCPDDSVTREQMAVFITRAMNEVPPDGYCGTTGPFSDVSADRWSCKYVKRLVELGITSGIGTGLFGPEDTVTREQMAAFLTRALNEVPNDGYCGAEDPFTDVPYSWWSCKYVKRLVELGITVGIGEGLYGLGNPVTRAQMAVFLARAFLGM